MPDQHPPCSVVLEGGVTSAVIYASLLARLARHYSFRQLGGASSGAVAATAAAAAEFARRHSAQQADTAFDPLGRFPEELATLEDGQTKLYRLFQPTPAARPAFHIIIAAIGTPGEGIARKAWRAGRALVAQFWLSALLLGLLVALTAWAAAGWWAARLQCQLDIDCMLLWLVAFLVNLLPALVGALVLLVARAVWVTVRALRANHWGLCNGSEQGGAREGSALATCLHGFFQTLAGPLARGPLTFGDLWWGPRPADGSPREEPPDRQIDLQIITSAISQARPVRLPGEPGEDPLREYFYDPLEWAHFFPPDVMQHLEARSRGARLRHDDGRELLSLPKPKDWPVLLAARFSLSFPLLLSAVPMYIALPRRKMLRAGAAATPLPFEARKVYFSDGGITSNCPVHLFDAPLPGYPTFGVNLHDLPAGRRRNASRSDTLDPEVDASATPDAAQWRSPLDLGLAIFDTMFSWRDSLQRRLPGYRERIVHIGVPPQAGGLNLAMPPKTIRKLARLGQAGAATLHRDFTRPRRNGEPNAWERHRWTRTRTTLSSLHNYLGLFAQRLSAGEPDYERLLRTAAPAEHPFQNEQARQQALELATGLRELVHAVDATLPPDAMDQHAPTPLPELHLSPPW